MISILIIGNEILSAQVEDTNLKYMLRKLNGAGYLIDEVRIVRDEEETISRAVQDLSARSQFLISSGGIGPTHDDVTLKAFSRAFGVTMVEHPKLVKKIREFFGDHVKSSTLRLSMAPENTELIYTAPSQWPIIKVANCFVLPGLPEVFVKKFDGVLEVLPPVPTRFYAELYTSSPEIDFALGLSAVQNNYPGVEIGSYPIYDRREYAARVTLKGGNVEEIHKVFEELKTLFMELETLVRWADPARYDPEQIAQG